jgi:hypothetical protein
MEMPTIILARSDPMKSIFLSINLSIKKTERVEKDKKGLSDKMGF